MKLRDKAEVSTRTRVIISCVVNSTVAFLISILCGAAYASEAKIEPETAEYSVLLSQRLSEITSLNAGFRQLGEGNAHSSVAVYEGNLWIARPSLFRVDTLVPSKQSLVSDGQDFWSFDEDLEQVIISQLNKNLSEVPILLFGSDFKIVQAAYTINGYSDEGRDYFLLEPNSEISLFRSLLLEFDGTTPVSIKINAATGEQMTITLIDVVLNEDIGNEHFEFYIPDDVDVIDER